MGSKFFRIIDEIRQLDQISYKIPVIDPCHTCGQNHANKRCARCFRIRYCDIHCATKDYINHKVECRLWRLSSKNINNNVINDNCIIKIVIDNTSDQHFQLLMGTTCKSWRSYIKSMYIVDENHKLYYIDDNLIGVIYSLKRRNPAYEGDYYAVPIYIAMAKSGKASYSVLKYINYANKWALELKFLAYRLCRYGNDELYNCLDKCLNYYYIDDEIFLKILIKNYLACCKEKYMKKNIIAIKQIIHKKYENSNKYDDGSLIDKVEKKLHKYMNS